MPEKLDGVSSGLGEVLVYDGEGAAKYYVFEVGGAEDLDAAIIVFSGTEESIVDDLLLARSFVLPTFEDAVVEFQHPVGQRFFHDEGGVGAVLDMLADERAQVHVGDDVNVVDQDGRTGEEERTGFQHPPTRVEEFIPFVREEDVHVEVVMGVQEGFHLPSEVVGVDHETIDPYSLHPANDPFEQGYPLKLYQGLGSVVGERPEARA